MKGIALLIACVVVCTAQAQTPSILLEACNQMEPASKRLECLRAANRPSGSSSAPQPTASRTTAPQSAYSAVTPSKPPATPVSSFTTSGGKTCYVGPRGGTYTITASGRKNYSGC